MEPFENIWHDSNFQFDVNKTLQLCVVCASINCLPISHYSWSWSQILIGLQKQTLFFLQIFIYQKMKICKKNLESWEFINRALDTHPTKAQAVCVWEKGTGWFYAEWEKVEDKKFRGEWLIKQEGKRWFGSLRVRGKGEEHSREQCGRPEVWTEDSCGIYTGRGNQKNVVFIQAGTSKFGSHTS